MVIPEVSTFDPHEQYERSAFIWAQGILHFLASSEGISALKESGNLDICGACIKRVNTASIILINSLIRMKSGNDILFASIASDNIGYQVFMHLKEGFLEDFTLMGHGLFVTFSGHLPHIKVSPFLIRQMERSGEARRIRRNVQLPVQVLYPPCGSTYEREKALIGPSKRFLHGSTQDCRSGHQDRRLRYRDHRPRYKHKLGEEIALQINEMIDP